MQLHSSMAALGGGRAAGLAVRVNFASSACGELQCEECEALSASRVWQDCSVRILRITSHTVINTVLRGLNFWPFDRPYTDLCSGMAVWAYGRLVGCQEISRLHSR